MLRLSKENLMLLRLWVHKIDANVHVPIRLHHPQPQRNRLLILSISGMIKQCGLMMPELRLKCGTNAVLCVASRFILRIGMINLLICCDVLCSVGIRDALEGRLKLIWLRSTEIGENVSETLLWSTNCRKDLGVWGRSCGRIWPWVGNACIEPP